MQTVETDRIANIINKNIIAERINMAVQEMAEIASKYYCSFCQYPIDI